MTEQSLWWFGAFRSGVGFPHEQQGAVEGDYPFCKASDVAAAPSEGLATAVHWVDQETADLLRARPVPAGSILFAKVGEAMRRAQRKRCLLPVCLDNNLVAFTPRIGDSRWWAYWFSVLQIEPLINPGPVPSLNLLALGNTKVAPPAVREQQAVADYLDAEVQRIEHARHRIGDLRTLLTARTDAAVVRALTRRQDAVEIGIYGSDYWIGDVPESWSVAPLGSRYRAVLGKMLNEERSAGDHQAPYLSNVDVRWDDFDLDSLRTMSFPPGEWGRYGVEVGDLLVCEGGEVGRAAVWTDSERKVYFQKALHRLRPINPGADEPRFLMYALMAAAKLGVFQAASSKATIDHLTGEKLAEHRFPFPPVREQREIVRELDRVRSDAAVIINRLDAQDALLVERKQALITAAVTGEITV